MLHKYIKSMGFPTPEKTITLVLADGRTIETSKVKCVEKRTVTGEVTVKISTETGNTYVAKNPVILPDPALPQPVIPGGNYTEVVEVVKPLVVGQKAVLILPDGGIIATSPVTLFTGDSEFLAIYTRNSCYVLFWAKAKK